MNTFAEKCRLCDRDMFLKAHSERHHLIPKSKKGKITAWVCVDCGNQVHRLFTNKELEKEYNTLEALKSHPDVQIWIKWIRKQKRFGVCHKTKKRKM